MLYDWVMCSRLSTASASNSAVLKNSPSVAETVTELLYVDCTWVLAFTEKNALDRGLGHTGYLAHPVWRYIILPAKLADAVGDNFLCVHMVYLVW